MKVNPIKTKKIKPNEDLFKFLDENLTGIEDNSVLAITSKIVAITEGSVREISKFNKKDLIKEQADFYTSADLKDYDITLSIKNNQLIPSAGIDESNGNGYFILWPQDPQESANKIRTYLKSRFKINNIGVILTDSTVPALKRGTIGVCLAHSGFEAVKNYVGKEDLFGRKMEYSMLNVKDNLASAANLEMGEGDESTPLAIISDIKNIKFQDRNPSVDELDFLAIEKENDLYQKLLNSVKWEKE